MKKNMIYITWGIRIVISFLFLLSAVAKMFPLWAFEKQLVDLGLTTWCQSHYLSRLLLGLELAIGLAILLPHYLKKIVIPCTILLLSLFCIHLVIEMVKHGAMNGNCGCFGQLIPMTPLEAFAKNIATMLLLIFLWFKVSDREKGENRFIYLVATYLGAALLVFMLFPFKPCEKTNQVNTSATVENPSTISVDTTIQEVAEFAELKDTVTTKKLKKVNKDSTIALSKTPKNKTPQSPTTTTPKSPSSATAATSKFSRFTSFGNVQVDMNQGKKIVCMFAAGCDHCQGVAKELGILAKQGEFPETYILFMDEETEKIPEFFKIAETTFPYQVLDIPQFWDLIGPGASTPGVYYLQYGQIVKSYQGIDNEKFKLEEFKSILKK